MPDGHSLKLDTAGASELFNVDRSEPSYFISEEGMPAMHNPNPLIL
jgi:hypothetical protein